MTRTVATNLTDLHAEPSFLSELLTQVTNGTELEILEEKPDWCRVRQTDGYTGWAYASYLQDAAPPPATHIVAAPKARILRNPLDDTTTPLSVLLGGTLLRAVEHVGDWSRIEPAGTMLPPGWVSAADLRPLDTLPLDPQTARSQIIADSRRLTGVYYLWGGTSAFGIDCSGLTQLVHRLAGYTIPRDARLQFPAGQAVEPPFEAGDLLFFHAESDPARITHVGISTGGWRMIHSSRARNGVYEEDVQQAPHLRDRFAGGRTFIS